VAVEQPRELAGDTTLAARLDRLQKAIARSGSSDASARASQRPASLRRGEFFRQAVSK
jgi:hypothetical protein